MIPTGSFAGDEMQQLSFSFKATYAKAKDDLLSKYSTEQPPEPPMKKDLNLANRRRNVSKAK